MADSLKLALQHLVRLLNPLQGSHAPRRNGFLNLVVVRCERLLERSLQQRKQEYAAYAERTSAFFPRPPKAA